MTRRVLIGILVFLVLVAGAVGVGTMAYRAGVMQGAIASGQVVVPPGGDGRGPMMWWNNGPMMFGHGRMGGFGAFGLVQCLVPLFGLFLLFALLRLAFGHRHWGWGGGYRRWGGPGGMGGPGMGWGNEEHPVPPAFEAWHRQAHGQAAPPPPAEPPAQPGQ